VLPHGYTGFTGATAPRHLVLSATTAVPLVVKIEDSAHRPPAFVSGARGSAFTVDGECAPSYLQTAIAPLAAFTLLGVPIERIGHEYVDVVDVFGAEGRRLAERVRDAATWRRRFALLDEFLLGRLQDGPRPAPETARAWQRIVGSRGAARIGDIAREVGWSHRRLIAAFRHQVGLTPKTAARLVRFEAMLADVRAGGPVRWERAAADAGYADQAHLTREFRSFTGTTPTLWLAAIPFKTGPQPAS
jgi:AraC-like DNA-binding protein